MAALLAMAMVGSGCARLVTLSPLEVAANNDVSWKLRNEPPVAAPVEPPPSVAAPVEPPPSVAAPVEPPPPVAAPVEPPPSVAPIVAAPIPMRARPEVQQALRSPPDALGIPTELYGADPILTAHRNDMRAEASARNQVGAGLVILGLAFGAYSAWAISTGEKDGNSLDQNTQKTGAQLAASGSILGIFALGELIAGIVMIATSPSSTSLTGYYQETYTDRR